MPKSGDTVQVEFRLTNLGPDGLRNKSVLISHAGLTFDSVELITSGSYDDADKIWELDRVFEYVAPGSVAKLVINFIVSATYDEPDILVTAADTTDSVEQVVFEDKVDDAEWYTKREVDSLLLLTEQTAKTAKSHVLSEIARINNIGGIDIREVFIDGSLVAATGVGPTQMVFYNAVILAVYGFLKTDSSSGNVEVDVNFDGVSVFLTAGDRLIFPAGEDSALAQTLLNNGILPGFGLLTLDIDSSGTDSQGLSVFIVLSSSVNQGLLPLPA